MDPATTATLLFAGAATLVTAGALIALRTSTKKREEEEGQRWRQVPASQRYSGLGTARITGNTVVTPTAGLSVQPRRGVIALGDDDGGYDPLDPFYDYAPGLVVGFVGASSDDTGVLTTSGDDGGACVVPDNATPAQSCDVADTSSSSGSSSYDSGSSSSSYDSGSSSSSSYDSGSSSSSSDSGSSSSDGGGW